MPRSLTSQHWVAGRDIKTLRALGPIWRVQSRASLHPFHLLCWDEMCPSGWRRKTWINYTRKREDTMTDVMSRQQSATQWYPSSFWRNWHKWHGTDRSFLKNRGSRSPRHRCPRSPVQYVPVVGTEQTLAVIGDSISAADGADVPGAGRHLSAFCVCSVVICTAVHLPKGHTATGGRKHSTFTAPTLHETVTRYNLRWVFHYHSTDLCWWGSLGRGESFLQRPPHTAAPDGVNQWCPFSALLLLPFYPVILNTWIF